MSKMRGISTIGASVLAVAMGTTALAGGAAYRGGMIRVYVHEKRHGGDNVCLWVPGVVVPIALRMAPKKELGRALKEAKDVLPALGVVARELENYPDTVLVEVVSPRERVKIEKRGSSLIVDVDSSRETVHVTLPLYVLQSVAERLEATRATQ